MKLRRFLLLMVFAFVLAPLQAHATPSTCTPFGFPGNPCPATHCEADGVAYAADCKQVHDSGIAGPYSQCEREGDGQFCKSVDVGGIPGAVKALGALLLIGLFWILPGVLVYRAANARGLDAGAVLGSWLVFGWLGVSYHLFKALPRKDQLEPSPSPDVIDQDVAGRMHRVTQLIADSKAAKRSR